MKGKGNQTMRAFNYVALIFDTHSAHINFQKMQYICWDDGNRRRANHRSFEIMEKKTVKMRLIFYISVFFSFILLSSPGMMCFRSTNQNFPCANRHQFLAKINKYIHVRCYFSGLKRESNRISMLMRATLFSGGNWLI